mgnify:CR=1 FL=1
MEYSDLMKQAEDFNKKLHRTKDVNIADILTYEDRDAIAKIVDNRVAKEYGDMFPFKWQMTIQGYFQITEKL